MEQIGNLIDKGKFKRRPRYTMILHNVREKLGISINTYIVVDSIHKLSTSNPNFPYCIMSKSEMGEFLGITGRTVFRCLNEAEEKGLIERHEAGLRASEEWIKTVELYDIKSER